MSARTPGEWAYSHGEIWTADGNVCVGVVSHRPNGFDEKHANGALLAAAPELAEALRVQHECGAPGRAYDAIGTPSWAWSHPDGRTWSAPVDGGPPPMHPLAAAALAKAGVA